MTQGQLVTDPGQLQPVTVFITGVNQDWTQDVAYSIKGS